jgi:hypothetical protein
MLAYMGKAIRLVCVGLTSSESAGGRAKSSRIAPPQFTLRSLLGSILLACAFLGLYVRYGQTAALIAVVLALIVWTLQTHRISFSARQFMLGVCTAALLGVGVGSLRLGGTMAGFWCIALSVDAEKVGLARPVGCALVTSVLFFVPAGLVQRILITPWRRSSTAVIFISLFLAPVIALFSVTAALFISRTAQWPSPHLGFLAAGNVFGVVLNLVALRLVLLNVESKCVAVSYGRWLILFNLIAVFLWGWPIADGP